MNESVTFLIDLFMSKHLACSDEKIPCYLELCIYSIHKVMIVKVSENFGKLFMNIAFL